MLDWAGLLLNAHYTQLVLMPEAHELLVSCHKLVAQQVQGTYYVLSIGLSFSRQGLVVLVCGWRGWLGKDLRHIKPLNCEVDMENYSPSCVCSLHSCKDG